MYWIVLVQAQTGPADGEAGRSLTLQIQLAAERTHASQPGSEYVGHTGFLRITRGWKG